MRSRERSQKETNINYSFFSLARLSAHCGVFFYTARYDSESHSMQIPGVTYEQVEQIENKNNEYFIFVSCCDLFRNLQGTSTYSAKLENLLSR